MLRVFLTVLCLGLMVAPAGLAASPRSADWTIPRPVTTPSSDRPARVIDVASGRYKWYELHRASLLSDGRLLLWESGRSLDDPGDWSISLLDAISGAIDTLWHGESNIDGKPILSADRHLAWFAAHVLPVTLSGVRDGLFVIDLQGRQIWPLDRVYDDATLIEEVLNKGYWKARAEPDGRLLIQFADLAAAEIWGKPRANWTVAPPERDVFPYAYLPSPLALFAQAGSGRRASPTFGVSDRALLKFDDARDPRPEPRAVGSERYWAPTDDGEYYSDNDLPTLRFAAAAELQVQLFNRWFDPQTMLPCGPGNAVMRNGAFIGTTTESGPRCARYQGAYVERIADGRLLHVLSHGVGVSHAIAAQGRLVAIGGRSEGLTLDGKPDPTQPNFVSLWDASAGQRLANLAFPPGDFSVRALVFSADARRLYAFVASPSQTQLYVWYLAPEWSALGTK
jgi:hypothetical protein